jgi:hypothetical protein
MDSTGHPPADIRPFGEKREEIIWGLRIHGERADSAETNQGRDQEMTSQRSNSYPIVNKRRNSAEEQKL